MTSEKQTEPVRRFTTGATRDLDQTKLDYEGFLSPIALFHFAQYMHKNRQTAAGVRDSDNWQRGIPLDSYMKSMFRHFMALWSIHRGLPADESLEDALGGLMFNVQGYMHETYKPKMAQEQENPYEEMSDSRLEEEIRESVSAANMAKRLIPTTAMAPAPDRAAASPKPRPGTSS